jgi:hypothetical protein
MGDATGGLTSLALVLLAAFWSGTNTVFTGIKEANVLRDRIVTGKAGDVELSPEERSRSLWWGWAPMKLSLAAVSVVLCIVILMLPRLNGVNSGGRNFVIVCNVTAAMPAIGAAYQFVSFLVELFYLKGVIRTASVSANTSET